MPIPETTKPAEAGCPGRCRLLLALLQRHRRCRARTGRPPCNTQLSSEIPNGFVAKTPEWMLLSLSFRRPDIEREFEDTCSQAPSFKCGGELHDGCGKSRANAIPPFQQDKMRIPISFGLHWQALPGLLVNARTGTGHRPRLLVSGLHACMPVRVGSNVEGGSKWHRSRKLRWTPTGHS